MSETTYYYIQDDGILRGFHSRDKYAMYRDVPLWTNEVQAWADYVHRMEDELEEDLAALERAQERVDKRRSVITQARARTLVLGQKKK